MKDQREWIKVTTEFPRHPKTVTLSDAAFRALITLWCYAMEYKTDGFLPKNFTKSVAKPRVIGELKSAGFLQENDNKTGFDLHDYTKHQQTSEEVKKTIEKKRKAKSRAGMASAHSRWHEPRNQYVADCELCNKSV